MRIVFFILWKIFSKCLNACHYWLIFANNVKYIFFEHFIVKQKYLFGEEIDLFLFCGQLFSKCLCVYHYCLIFANNAKFVVKQKYLF
jgi:hypothetical protein